MNGTPKGIYFVAAVFFFSGLVCIGNLLPPIFYLLGFERGRGLLFQPGYLWVILCGLLLFWLLCYGVVAVVRFRRAAPFVLLAMTLFLTSRFLTEPAAGSPFHSPRQILVHRILLLLPLIASCVYLFRLRFLSARSNR